MNSKLLLHFDPRSHRIISSSARLKCDWQGLPTLDGARNETRRGSLRTRALALVLVISAVMATLACSSDPEIKAASFTAADYSFSGPATL
jgi:hypothetical protein